MHYPFSLRTLWATLLLLLAVLDSMKYLHIGENSAAPMGSLAEAKLLKKIIKAKLFLKKTLGGGMGKGGGSTPMVHFVIPLFISRNNGEGGSSGGDEGGSGDSGSGGGGDSSGNGKNFNLQRLLSGGTGGIKKFPQLPFSIKSWMPPSTDQQSTMAPKTTEDTSNNDKKEEKDSKKDDDDDCMPTKAMFAYGTAFKPSFFNSMKDDFINPYHHGSMYPYKPKFPTHNSYQPPNRHRTEQRSYGNTKGYNYNNYNGYNGYNNGNGYNGYNSNNGNNGNNGKGYNYNNQRPQTTRHPEQWMEDEEEDESNYGVNNLGWHEPVMLMMTNANTNSNNNQNKENNNKNNNRNYNNNNPKPSIQPKRDLLQESMSDPNSMVIQMEPITKPVLINQPVYQHREQLNPLLRATSNNNNNNNNNNKLTPRTEIETMNPTKSTNNNHQQQQSV